MKKNHLSIVVILATLALSAMACRLPFFSRAEETPVLTTEGSPLAEESPQEGSTEPSPSSSQLGFSGETQVYSNNGVQITLPASFEMGDIQGQLANLLDRIQSLPEFGSGSIEEFYANNSDDILLWAFDTGSAEDYRTDMLVLKNEEFAGLSLGIVSTLERTLLGNTIEVIEQERITLGDRDTLRFLVSAEDVGVDQAQVIYLLRDSGKLWILGFLTSQVPIEQHLPTFDAAVASFTVVDVD